MNPDGAVSEGKLPMTVERFWSKVNKTESCWLWMASTVWNGYGRFRVGSTLQRAHRISWELYNGPIPDGLSILHSCDTPACVRPDHLFLGTQEDNPAGQEYVEATWRWNGNEVTKRIKTPGWTGNQGYHPTVAEVWSPKGHPGNVEMYLEDVPTFEGDALYWHVEGEWTPEGTFEEFVVR